MKKEENKNNNKEQEELKDEQLDNVAGGGLFSSLFVDWPVDFSDC